MTGLDYRCPRCGIQATGLTAEGLAYLLRDHPKHCGKSAEDCPACKAEQ